jgi:two-component system sensor histidine kinase UhpB
MATELTPSGIRAVQDIPWGTHFCCFYETKARLIDTLVHYFQAGLQNNEGCLWLIFDPLTETEARNALRRVVPGLDRYIAEGHIEIRAPHKHLLQGAAFGPNGMRCALEESVERALARGLAGMRIAGGSHSFLKKDEWHYREVEREVTRAVLSRRMIKLCTFPVTGITTFELLTAARMHEFAIVRRNGDWGAVETSTCARALEEFKKPFDQLERRVMERTNALAAANEDLRREISERHRVGTELRQQKEILQKIFDHIPVMINFVDADGKLSMVNRQWEHTLGWSLQEILDEKIDILEENYPDPAYREQVRAFVHGTHGEWGDFKTTVRDGRVIDTSWAMLHLSDGSGIGIGTDITARKRTEDALRESEERFRELTENIREVFWIRTPDFKRILYISPMYERVCGGTREDLYAIEDSLSSMPGVFFEDRERVLHEILSNREKEFELEYRIVPKDGSIRWIRDRCFPIRERSGQICRIVGIAEDITERKLAEQERNLAQARLKATSEQLRALSANLQSAREEERTRIAREIHDELGSALTALNWNLEELDKTFSQYVSGPELETLRHQTKAMMRQTDAIISNIRRIASDLRPAILDLGLVDAIEWQAQQFQQRTGIRCLIDCDTDSVHVNKEQSIAVFRILQETLTNVLRHAQATEVNIAIEETSLGLALKIHDNGKGITEQEKTDHMALGLLGMQERAHLAGGTIDIAGIKGRGTTVTVRIPLASRQAAGMTRDRSAFFRSPFLSPYEIQNETDPHR